MSTDRDHLIGEPEYSLEDALAVCLRRIMAQGSRPYRPEYRHDPELYDLHARQWDDAEKVLAAYDATKQ